MEVAVDRDAGGQGSSHVLVSLLGGVVLAGRRGLGAGLDLGQSLVFVGRLGRVDATFGGELVDPSKTVFKDVNDIHIVGMFPDYASAYDAWKAEAQRTVDNAHMRYFIAHLHRLRDEEAIASPTEELG